MIGLRSGDIGDYSQPSERLYTQIFNQTGLSTLVYTRYFPQNINGLPIVDGQRSNLPFYYRSGPFFGVRHHLTNLEINSFFQLDWWIILILVVGILTIWLLVFLLCYYCCRRR